MRIVSFRQLGNTEAEAGLLLADGGVAALGSFGYPTVQDVLDQWASARERLRSAALDLAGSGLVVHAAGDVSLTAPLPRPTKMTAVGLNYRDHALEAGAPIPAEPMLFTKAVTSVIGPGETILLPPEAEKIDYEAELAVVIGQAGHRVSVESADEHIAGYMCLNDVSARDWQARQPQWTAAKSFETFTPTGPWMATADELGDAGRLGIKCRVNGQTVQSSSTDQMVFSCAEIVSYVSHVWRLEPGDVIATGTPPGVGVARKPPVFLTEGDVVEVEIDGLGVLRNSVRRSPESAWNQRMRVEPVR